MALRPDPELIAAYHFFSWILQKVVRPCTRNDLAFGLVVMLAYLIFRDLEEAWPNLNLTAQKGLDHLETLSAVEGGKGEPVPCAFQSPAHCLPGSYQPSM